MCQRRRQKEYKNPSNFDKVTVIYWLLSLWIGGAIKGVNEKKKNGKGGKVPLKNPKQTGFSFFYLNFILSSSPPYTGSFPVCFSIWPS